MNCSHLMAIDPGKSGGIAVYDSTGAIRTFSMPPSFEMTRDLVREELHLAQAAKKLLVACIEVPPRFVRGNDKSTAARISVLFENYGFLRGLLYGMGINAQPIQPREWQKQYADRDGMEYAHWKRRLKEIAVATYPGRRVTLGTSDALLILDYMLRARGIKKPGSVIRLRGEEQTVLI